MAAKKKAKKRSDFATQAEYRRWKQRSDAAKRGAKTKLRKRIEDANGFRSPIIRGLQIEPIPDNLTMEQLRWRLLETQARLAMEVLTRGFVDSQDIERLHKDMTLALMPSRLRHMGALTDEMEKALKRAARKGKRALRKQAKEYAMYFDVPLREVYTLFMSP